MSNISITDAQLAGSSTITKEGDFEFNSIGVSSGSAASSFSTTDGSSYTANNTTGTITVDHPLDSVSSQSCTYTWLRDGDNIRANTGSGSEGFALTNTGTGADAWTFSPATFTAATSKTVTVTHTQSGLTITMSCFVIDTSSSGGGGGGGGGCFLPGTLVDLEEGQQAIESLKVGQKIKGATVTKKESFEVDYWYKLNDIQITAGHPVWIEDKGWSCIDPGEYYREHQLFGHKIELEPKQIEIGDMTTNGSIDIINRIDEKQTVWNITVDNEHTYYVDGMLVHNSKQ